MVQVIINQESEGDKGTLKQLQTAINRTNIPPKVKDDPMAVEDFMDLTLDAHIVAAAMKFFQMSTTKDLPATNINIGNIMQTPKHERWNALVLAIRKFLNEYLSHGKASKVTCALEGISQKPKTRSKKTETDTKAGKKQTQKTSTSNAQGLSEDGVFNYACRVLGMNLLARNFHDASREGDGDRTIRCWKFLLLHFKVDGRVKYSVEAFHLLAQINALLPPFMANQLKWNRTCNVTGGKGKNIPFNLMVEHYNRVFKDDVNKFRANITKASISRSSRAIGVMKDLLEKFDRMTNVVDIIQCHLMTKTLISCLIF